jgi:hypothetical protein
MHAWHELATLFVHPTLYEGSSLVTLEAMAHRRAVVASAAGGIPDKVKPGENGWLVPPGDPSALAAAISGALADETRLARYGTAAARSSNASSRGTPPATPRSPCIDGCSGKLQLFYMAIAVRRDRVVPPASASRTSARARADRGGDAAILGPAAWRAVRRRRSTSLR